MNNYKEVKVIYKKGMIYQLFLKREAEASLIYCLKLIEPDYNKMLIEYKQLLIKL